MPARSSAGIRPRAASSLMAWGRVLMPTPSSRGCSTCSNMVQGMEAACNESAAARPPMPPPTIRTCIGCVSFAAVQSNSLGWQARTMVQVRAEYQLLSRLRTCSLLSNFRYRIGAAVYTDQILDLAGIRYISDEIVAAECLEMFQCRGRGIARLFADNFPRRPHSRFGPD